MFCFEIPHYVKVQTFIAACINLGEVINGFGVGWSGSMLVKFDDSTQSPLSHAISEGQKSWIASIVYFGCFATFLGGFLANRIGRRKSLMIGGFMHIVSYAILAFANSLVMTYIGRLAVGVSIFTMTVVGMIYIGEIASPDIRGIILTSMGVSHAVGSLLVYSVAPFVGYTSVGYVIIALCVIFIAACYFLPESPMYHVLKDDEDSAKSVLQYLGRSVDVSNELKIMMEKVREQWSNKHIWDELLTLKSNRKSLLISVFLTSFQQCSGIMAVILYANTIFGYSGSTIKPEIDTIIVGATFVVGAMLAPMFIDKYGRKTLLLISTASLGLLMAGLGVYFYMRQTQPSSVESMGWLPLALLILAQFAYSLGLSIVPNTLSSELFTPKVRGLGPSISLCCCSAAGLIIITLFGYIMVAVGIYLTFWISAISNVFAFIFVLAFVPETTGKTLLEIQEMLEK